MKILLLTGFLLIVCGCSDDSEDPPPNPTTDLTLTGNTRFANAAAAQQLLTTADQFTGSWSQFDIDARLKKAQGTSQELLEYVSAQALDWTTQEEDKVERAILKIHNRLIDLDFKIDFDYDIDLVKTTGDEEGGANGYTRQNYIVLNDNALSTSDDNLAQLISHELFHIICRNDETLREEIYAIIGFEIGNVVPVPDQLKDLRMTNPDAVAWDSFITLTDDEENVAEYLMITYSNEPYTTGTFFSYLNVGFLKVTGTGTRVVGLENGEPLIRVYEDFSDFYDQVGNNTNYTVHPEEILADNFALVIMSATGVPSAWLLDEMKSRLSQ